MGAEQVLAEEAKGRTAATWHFAACFQDNYTPARLPIPLVALLLEFSILPYMLVGPEAWFSALLSQLILTLPP